MTQDERNQLYEFEYALMRIILHADLRDIRRLRKVIMEELKDEKED